LAEGVTGRVHLRYTVRTGGQNRSVSRSVTVRPGKRRFTVRLTLPRAMRSARRGTLRMIYRGSTTHEPQRIVTTLKRR
jgi:hypothetical protein